MLREASAWDSSFSITVLILIFVLNNSTKFPLVLFQKVSVLNIIAHFHIYKLGIVASLSEMVSLWIVALLSNWGNRAFQQCASLQLWSIKHGGLWSLIQCRFDKPKSTSPFHGPFDNVLLFVDLRYRTHQNQHRFEISWFFFLFFCILPFSLPPILAHCLRTCINSNE